MKNELNDLIQEIVSFSNAISSTNNPGNSNFQNACELFSGYLDNHFAEIKSKPHFRDCKENTNWTCEEITKLSDLIYSQENSSALYSQWIHDLSKYCEELQHNKIATA